MGEAQREVMEQFMRLQMLLHRYHMQNLRSFGPFNNPHRGQGRVLAILQLKPEISQRELSYLLNMSKQSLAELLSKLEKSGCIQREASEEDRRVSIIKLTEAGAAVAAEMDDAAPEADRLLDCLSDEELHALRQYLDCIIQRLEEQFPDADNDLRRQMMERLMLRREHLMRQFAEDQAGHHGGPQGHHSCGRGFPGFRGGGSPHGRGGRPNEDDEKGMH